VRCGTDRATDSETDGYSGEVRLSSVVQTERLDSTDSDWILRLAVIVVR
jgi:hypothetical protein